MITHQTAFVRTFKISKVDADGILRPLKSSTLSSLEGASRRSPAAVVFTCVYGDRAIRVGGGSGEDRRSAGIAMWDPHYHDADKAS